MTVEEKVDHSGKGENGGSDTFMGFRAAVN